MIYDAKYFADLFVEVAKKESSRRSINHGISVDTGHIPYDTGAQNIIYVSRASEKSAEVSIGGDVAHAYFLENADNVANTSAVNVHKHFVEKFIRSEFAQALKKKFGKVKIL